MKKLIAGNWKMNGTVMAAEDLISALAERTAGVKGLPDIVVCPPFVHLQAVLNESSPVMVGAQDCSGFENGAHTGDVSAGMLAEIGCKYVILGHSERRQGHGESDAEVREKARRAHEAGLIAIICVGETEEEREKGEEERVIQAQIDGSLPESATAENTVIAYEPVWAIGTGKTANPADVKDMHGFIRGKLQEKLANYAEMRILYGGSMKPENAAALLSTENVDGGLIGGASLDVEQFTDIINAGKE